MQTTRGASLTDADPPEPAAEPPRRPSRWPLAILAVVAVAVLVADIISKIEIVGHLEPGQEVDVVGSVLRVTLTRNSGAAFSIGQGATALFAAVAVGVVVAIIRTARRLRSTGWAVALGLLLGGALGNLVDRIFREPGPFRGYVVDWIHVTHFPVFNIADSGITIGGCLAVLLALQGFEIDGRRRAADLVDDSVQSDEADRPAGDR